MFIDLYGFQIGIVSYSLVLNFNLMTIRYKGLWLCNLIIYV